MNANAGCWMCNPNRGDIIDKMLAGKLCLCVGHAVVVAGQLAQLIMENQQDEREEAALLASL